MAVVLDRTWRIRQSATGSIASNVIQHDIESIQDVAFDFDDVLSDGDSVYLVFKLTDETDEGTKLTTGATLVDTRNSQVAVTLSGGAVGDDEPVQRQIKCVVQTANNYRIAGIGVVEITG